MEEETITCGNCGRGVPRTLYCIYCGSALFKKEETGSKVISSKDSAQVLIQQRKPEPVVEESLELEFAQTPVIEDEPEPWIGIEIEPEIDELMEQLKNNYIWKVNLCGVLCDGGVSENIFSKIFEEYVNKINQLSQVRNERLTYFREESDKKRSELGDVKRKLEELKVRVAVGQISAEDLKANAPELEEKIESLAMETTRLDAHIKRLTDLMKGSSPKEIHTLEMTARTCLDSLGSMIANGTISNDLGSDLGKGLEAAIDIFDGIIGDKKSRAEGLRDQMSTLEARYKVGEINISEFEAHKRRINQELEKIWT